MIQAILPKTLRTGKDTQIKNRTISQVLFTFLTPLILQNTSTSKLMVEDLPQSDRPSNWVVAVDDSINSTQKFIYTGYLGDVLFT